MIGLQDIILIAAAYLIGSIPTSVWIGQRFYNIDVRKHGSGNSGATNSVRILGKKAGVVVLLIDTLKGWLAVGMVCISPYTTSSPQHIHLEVALACAVVVGHVWSLYVRFKGGKGIATSLGAIIALSPIVALFIFLVFAVVFFMFHYVSLASLAAAISFPVWMALMCKMHSKWIVAFSVFIPVLVIFTHRKNIGRLIRGEESKIELFKKQGT